MQNQPHQQHEPDQSLQSREHDGPANDQKATHGQPQSGKGNRIWALVTLIAFLGGSLGGYFAGVFSHQMEMDQQANAGQVELAALARQINPPDGFTVQAAYGVIGPQLLEAGAFRLDYFAQVYQQAGQPLDEEQLQVLKVGSPARITFSQQNAYFLLNFFWALGLTNRNPILEEGPLVQYGREQVINFASTGGWSLAARPVTELYSSTEIVPLTAEQQDRLEEVAQGVFRPCCDNPTHFPDCNHGMAMLGLLTLLAANNASVDEMFTAAKYANAYWYPSQSLELAQYFYATREVDFASAESRLLVGLNYSSISGFRNVHQWLSENGLLQQAPGGGNSCGV